MEDIKNLFYVGAGTHPGAGVPGVINSAKLLKRLFTHEELFKCNAKKWKNFFFGLLGF